MSTRHRFGDLVAHAIGGGWGAEEPKDESDGPAFVIRGTDIPRALVGDVSSVPLRYHKKSALRSRTLQHNDIVFEVSGGSKGQPVGRALLVNQRLLDGFSSDVICASFCKLVRLDASSCDPRFVFRLLQHAYQDGRLLRYQVQSTGISNFTWQPFLDHFEVDLPAPAIQERVAETLDAFDELIENNRRRIEILEEMARLIYREWFVHFRFPGHEDTEFVDTELRSVPQGWEVVPVGQVCDVLGGGTPSRKVEEYWEDGSIPWYTPSDLTKNPAMFAFESGERITPLGLAKSSAKVFPAGSVMMTSRATIGALAIATTDSCTNQGFIVCVPSDLLSNYHLYFWLEDNVELFLGLAGGATFKELRRSIFRELPIILPSQGVEEGFVERVAPMCELIAMLLQQNRVLQEARDLLLPRLVSGELDVSEFDFDLVSAD